MNKQELIERIEGLKNIFGNKCEYVKIDFVIELASELDEPEAGHADEAPRYVKNILARLRELPLHDREVWLKAIMGEFEQDFSRAKWREGYEQGKVEGLIEREKVTVPQFVADWIEVCKEHLTSSLYLAMTPSFLKANNQSFELILWIKKKENQEIFALAWINGYEVEKEKRYLVRMKGLETDLCFLNCNTGENYWTFSDEEENNLYKTHHTRNELEGAGFGEVFNSPLFEVEEVTE